MFPDKTYQASIYVHTILTRLYTLVYHHNCMKIDKSEDDRPLQQLLCTQNWGN